MAGETSQPTRGGTTAQESGRAEGWIGPDPVDHRAAPDTPPEPPRVAAAGRILMAVARWLLFIALIGLAPVALIAWSVTPRVTSPSQLADEAIASGLTKGVRGALVDQLTTELVELEDSPLHAGELRPVIERNLSQGWFDEQLTRLAAELDRWLGTSRDELPNLVIDLTPVKESLAADAGALSLIAPAMGCTVPRCPSAAPALGDMLDRVPDEVAILTIGTESDTDSRQEIMDARTRFQTIDRLIAMIPLVLVAGLTALVLLARPGSRVRWLGTTLVVIAIPVLATAMLLPGWAARRVAGSLPDDIRLDLSSIRDAFNWAIRPAETAAWWMLLAGVVALVAAIAGEARRRRSGDCAAPPPPSA